MSCCCPEMKLGENTGDYVHAAIKHFVTLDNSELFLQDLGGVI